MKFSMKFFLIDQYFVRNLIFEDNYNIITL